MDRKCQTLEDRNVSNQNRVQVKITENKSFMENEKEYTNE